jgi:hypothetical protein
VKNVLATGAESGSAIGHDTFTLGGSNLATKIGLTRLAELALTTFGGVKGNNVIADLDVSDALTNGLDNTSTLVSKNDRESTFGVLTGKSVGISVADTSVGNLDTDLMGAGRENLNILNRERLASFPGNGGLTSDSFTFGRHDDLMNR